MPYLDGSLKRALAAGTTVVTPNRRLARALVTLYDRSQRTEGRGAWTAARALPWDAWISTLWLEALAAGAVPEGASLRTSLQAGHAWNRIVADEDASLIDPRGAAVIARDAWTLMHAWGAGGDSWRAWAGAAGIDDCATFARWASRYARELRAANVDRHGRASRPDRRMGEADAAGARNAGGALRIRRILAAAGAARRGARVRRGHDHARGGAGRSVRAHRARRGGDTAR